MILNAREITLQQEYMKKILYLLLIWLIGNSNAFAATYTLPSGIGSNPFNGCSGTDPDYSCNSSISLPEDTTIILTADVTLNITGDFYAGEDFVVQANGYSLNINATNDVRFIGKANFTGNISAGDDITIGEDSTLTGNLTAADNLSLGQDTVVSGICSPTHAQCTGVSPTPTAGCETLADNFNVISYGNQNGTINWASDWIESNDDGLANSGEIYITGNRLDIENNNRAITRNGDLSTYTSATLTFGYQESSFDNNNDYINVEIQGGGNGWTTLQSFVGSNVGSGNANLSIPASYLSSNFQIRFITSNNLGGSDRFYVDNLTIEACGAASLTASMDFHFDEISWTGSTNEVIDSSAGANHASISSGSGVNTTALGQVCRTGLFDGVNDYLVSNDIYAVLRTTASMSFWIKTTQTGNNTNWQAPGVAGIEQSGGGDDIFWGWLDASGHIGISKWDTPSAKSSVAINDGVYHHVVLTRESSSGAYKIYIDGALNATGTTGAGDVGTNFTSIGRIEDTAGSHEYLRADLDELMIFNTVLSDAQVSSIYSNQLAGNNYDGSSRACAVTGPDHYQVSHSGLGVTCEAEPITVSAHDASHTPMSPSAGTTITLSTSQANDGWALRNGGGTFTPPDQYSFSGSESSVQFWLIKTSSTTAPHMDIDISDGVASDNDDGGSEDPGNIEFRDTGLRFYADAVNNSISTQIAGKDSNINPGSQSLTLKAVQTNSDTGACEAVLTGTTTVQLAVECNNPSSCIRPLYLGSSSASTAISGTNSGNSLNYQDVTLDFGVTGEASFVMNYPDSGEIQLYAQHTLPASPLPSTGITLNGSSNRFVSRPFGFHIDVVDNPAASTFNGAIFTSAGSQFTVNVSGSLWNSADDSNNDGIPDNHDDDDPSNNVNLGNNSVTLGGTSYSGIPNFGQEGAQVNLQAILIDPIGSSYPDADFPLQSLTGFSDGTDSTANAAFNDVGIIELRALISNGNYLGTGTAETANMISKSGYVGRFTPAAFSVEVTNNGVLENTCTTPNPFTYIGQDFGYLVNPVLKVSALNTLSAITENYQGNYVKLNANSLTINVSQDSTTVGSNIDPTPLLLSYNPQTMNFVANNDGTVNYTLGADQYRYGDTVTSNTFIKLPNSEVAPFTADIDPLITQITDTEITTAVSQTINLAGNNLRFGRIRMSNAFGSELMSLQMPMIVEYYNGTSYQLNQDDSCTQFVNADLITISDNLITPGESTISVTNPTAVAGILDVTFTSPGANNVGTIDLSALLSAGTIENKWLRYDWDGDGSFDDDPSASATFGIYNGDSRYIYYRQTYQ